MKHELISRFHEWHRLNVFRSYWWKGANALPTGRNTTVNRGRRECLLRRYYGK
jgi:hypothetical protein